MLFLLAHFVNQLDVVRDDHDAPLIVALYTDVYRETDIYVDR